MNNNDTINDIVEIIAYDRVIELTVTLVLG
jgi:hypothetical protein